MRNILITILLAVLMIDGCTKNEDDRKKKEEEKKQQTGASIMMRPSTPPAEDTCTAVSSLPITTKESTVTIPLTVGSGFVVVKLDTKISQRETIKSTDIRELKLTLPTEGKYLVQFFKIDNKTVAISELDVLRKTSIDSPKITTDALQNNLTGDYETTSATLNITVTPTEKIKTFFCNDVDRSNASLKLGEPTSFPIQIGISVTVSCVVTDFADNTKILPSFDVKKVSTSAWLQSLLPMSYPVPKNSESALSCYKGNLRDLTITAKGIPLAPTTNPDGSICVTVLVPFGSKITEIIVQGTNAANNMYTVTHHITQNQEINPPSITSINPTKIKVTSTKEVGIETTTEVYADGKFIDSFVDAEKVLDLTGIAPVGAMVISTKNKRLGYSSISSYYNYFNTFIVKASDVIAFKIDNFLGNFLPTSYDFTDIGLKATTKYGLASRSFLRAIFTLPATGLSQSVQLTIRPKSKTDWDTLREGGSYAGPFNQTYVGKYRLYNFVTRKYQEAIIVEGSEKIPVTFTITSENVSNNQVIVLFESGTNVKEETGAFYYVIGQYSDCMEPSWNHRYFSCPYNSGSFRNEDGFGCGQHDAWCFERQFVVTSNTIELPVTEIGFAVFE